MNTATMECVSVRIRCLPVSPRIQTGWWVGGLGAWEPCKKVHLWTN